MLSYDFYIPNNNVVIEFQGKQHFEPIEYFGGKEYFEPAKRTIQIDHHSVNSMFADFNYVDPVAPACCQVLIAMFEYLKHYKYHQGKIIF